jgi:hypothetical protein
MRISTAILSVLFSSTVFAGSNGVIHYSGPVTFEGPWIIKESMLEKSFNNMPLSRFGTTAITLPGGLSAPNIIREFHYNLCPVESTLYPMRENNRPRCRRGDILGIGIRAIPIVNGAYKSIDKAPTANVSQIGGETTTIRGSELVDNFLREIYGYQGEDLDSGPVFALTGYYHPEFYDVNLLELGNPEFRKTENGITHLGSYIGNGHARNAPVDHHNWTWGLIHEKTSLAYPANVYIVQYNGARNQKIFNQNALITLKILNELNGGPVFPENYKFDHYRAINLKESLEFYQAWLDRDYTRPGDDEPLLIKLQVEDSWATYCAEHLTIALNVALNLAQNLQGYKDVWGEEYGTFLWEKAQERWPRDRKVKKKMIKSAPLVGIPEGDDNFMPLWKLMGLKKPTAVTRAGKALAFPPETTADVARSLIDHYANWGLVGPVFSSALLMGFAPEIQKRTAVSPETFFAQVSPILTKIFLYDTAWKLSQFFADMDGIAIGASDIMYEIKKTTDLYKHGHVSNPQMTSLAGVLAYGLSLQDDNPERVALLAQNLSTKILSPLNQPESIALMVHLATKYSYNKDSEKRLNWIRFEYKNAIEAELKLARNIPIPDIDEQEDEGVKLVNHLSTPAAIQRIINGLHPRNPHVFFRAVATVFDVRDIEALPMDTKRMICDPVGDICTPK